MKILITGANGHLGQRLISALAEQHRVVAVVRSQRAADSLADKPVERVVVSYSDAAALAKAAEGCDACVHLVGIIKESAGNRFEDAHELPCQALAQAAAVAGIKHIVSLSIIGASVDSANACLRSRALADNLLLSGGVPTSVLRVPMVLGEGDYASRALIGRARSRFAFTFRAASLEQPIYGGDVVAAIVSLLEQGQARGVLELGGPESVSRSELTRRAGKVIGTHPRLISLPLGLGLALAWCLEQLSASPPVSCDMLNLLDHDDCVDNAHALQQTGIELTALDDVLKKVSA